MIFDEPILEGEWLDAQLPTELSPEKHLLLAVLLDAINTAYSRVAIMKRAHDEARVWIMSRETKGLFCFVQICEALSLDVNATRKAIVHTRGWKEAA